MSQIFFSYSRADSAAVKPLVAALRAAGVEVWQDESAIGDFDPIHDDIVEGLKGSAALLAWYSQSYPERPYCQWELTAAWLAGEAEGKRRVLVVNPEANVSHIYPESLRKQSIPKAADLDKLVAAIKKQLETLSGPLGDITSAGDPPWYGRTAPERRKFIGRLPQLWRIHDGLRPGALTLISATAGTAGTAGVRVQGLGGVGKTMLAEEYALRFGGAYPGGVFWLAASDGGGKKPEDFAQYRRARFERLARELYPELWDRPAEQVLARLAADLKQKDKPYLWVIDDWPHGADGRTLAEWRAPGARGHTLVTTRERNLAGTLINLDCLEPGEATALLANHRPPATDDERAAAKELARRLGYHPLALDVAGAALRHQSYRRFLNLLDGSLAKALNHAASLKAMLPTGHERDIVATLAWSLADLDDAGRDLLRLAAQLAVVPIPTELLAAALARADGVPVEEAELTLVATIHAVAARSLLSENQSEQTITVHALVGHALAALHPDPERAAALRIAVTGALTESFGKYVHDNREHGRLQPLLPHALHLSANAAEDDPSLDLLGWLGNYDRARGDYGAAAARFSRVRAGCERLHGPEHPDTLAAMGNLAEMLGKQGDHAGARQLEEQVLELRRRVLGPDHPATLLSMNNLAVTLDEQGDHAGARQLKEQVLELHRRLLGPDHPDTLRA
ncbi:MAG: tetratricopeptide repeat protein [Rhodospirillaceae bacterium]